jgi:hypothetical protein
VKDLEDMSRLSESHQKDSRQRICCVQTSTENTSILEHGQEHSLRMLNGFDSRQQLRPPKPTARNYHCHKASNHGGKASVPGYRH